MSADRPYHHGNLRAALLDAAVELAAESGPDAVVLREASRQVGVSHNAGYRHFAGRDGLLVEVAERAMARLAEVMRAALALVPTVPGSVAAAQARLRAIGSSYVGFALQETGLFRTAFATGNLSHAQPEPAADDGPFGVLLGVVEEFVTAGSLPAEQAYASAVSAWAAVHGLCVLILDGPLAGLAAQDVVRLQERVFEVVEDGIPARS